MQRKIPAGLLPEIADRHRAGQSDQAITDWLAQLNPPVVVSRVAVLGARRKATGQPTKPRAAKSPPATTTAQAVASMAPVKKTGAQNRKIAAAQNAVNAADHKKRKAVIVPIAAEGDPLRAHLYELQNLLWYQHEINADKYMNLPDKVRNTATLAQAMGKVSVQADLERKHAVAEQERQREAADFAEDVRAVAVQKKEVEAQKAEIEAEWQKLNEARARVAAQLHAAGLPVIQAVV